MGNSKGRFCSMRKLNPVASAQVKVEGMFWAPRIETNRKVTLFTVYEQLKKTGRIDAWKWKPGKPNEPQTVWDSDVAKWMEAAAYSLATHPDRKLEKQLNYIINMMADGQMKDGYLNSHYSLVEPEKRWINLRDGHELYCAGHLMEAAVACGEATGKRKFLDITCRYADYIGKVFGPKKGQKHGYPGHEEIELALVKLYRATGKERYFKLAKFFVDERGRKPYYFDKEAKVRAAAVLRDRRYGGYENAQAHLPVREQHTAEGHAVRACYLYAGMADVAAETHDRTLLDACRRLWGNITERRMYITGGIGSVNFRERFTFDYDLPNEAAYAETCAAIALIFFAHRMLQIEADGRYADVMEQALYNGFLGGVSPDGKRFFYVNPLAQHVEMSRYNDWAISRKEWFDCACCPPNIARLLASFGGYVYSQRRNEVWIHLYVGGTAELDVAGRRVLIEQKTRYPWTGEVHLTVLPENSVTLTLALRIPGWCRGAKLKVNGKSVDVGAVKGYVRIKREWKMGDKVDLTLPLPVERVESHPKVRHNAGRVALQRGPVVYCLEEADNGKYLNDFVVARNTKLTAKFDPKLFNGITVITGKAKRRDQSTWKNKLYRQAGSKTRTVFFKAIPYAFWANRKDGEMLVWIRSG